MIWESGPWKEDLLRIAGILEKRYNQKRWPDRSLYLLEKEIFLGFFAVRKLLESNKISKDLAKQELHLAVYPAEKNEIELLNQNKLGELYDLYAGEKEFINYEQISNQFIHSSIFAPLTPSGRSLMGVYIASDRAKKQKLYYIQLVKIIQIFRSVGSDYPMIYNVRFDEEKNEFVVSLA